MYIKEKLERVANKYFSAVLFLAQCDCKHGEAIAQLFSRSFEDFIVPGKEFNNVPYCCAEQFEILNKDLDSINKKVQEKENQTLQNYAKTLNKSKKTKRIIDNICLIAFSLKELLQKETLHPDDFVSGDDFKSEIIF